MPQTLINEQTREYEEKAECTIYFEVSESLEPKRRSEPISSAESFAFVLLFGEARSSPLPFLSVNLWSSFGRLLLGLLQVDGPYRAMVLPAAKEEGKNIKKR